MKDLLAYIVKVLVNSPDQVEITEETKGDQTVFRLKVAQEDRGRVIGKRGKTVQAIRSVMNAAASLKNRRADVEVID